MLWQGKAIIRSARRQVASVGYDSDTGIHLLDRPYHSSNTEDEINVSLCKYDRV